MDEEAGDDYMSATRYDWWPYVKGIIRRYPEQIDRTLPFRERIEFRAVQEAINATKQMSDGEARMKAIHMLHWRKTKKTVQETAQAIPCDRTTVLRWQKQFFELVKRNFAIF